MMALSTKNAVDERVLFATLEFVDPIFSGNGVYSRSIVQILSEHLRWPCLVLCARDGTTEDASAKNVWRKTENSGAEVEVVSFPVSKWNSLGRQSSWEEWVEICAREAGEAIAKFRPTLWMGVDWTGMRALQTIPGRPPPCVYFVFRIFASPYTEASEEDKVFYAQQERFSLLKADISFSCSSQDAGMLVDQLVHCADSEAEELRSRSRFLNPPLRDGFLHLLEEMESTTSSTPMTTPQQRDLILCCCRLSSEKRVHFFVDLVCDPAVKRTMKELKLTPCLVGARAGDDERYCDDLLAKLNAHWPEATVKTSFVAPAQLVDVFRHTQLNVHPALYDSYAMTLAEAAACGVPSLLHRERVGAVDVLGEDGVIRADMGSLEAAAERLIQVLTMWNTTTTTHDGRGQEEQGAVEHWKSLSCRVSDRSRTWTSEAFAKRIVEELNRYRILDSDA